MGLESELVLGLIAFATSMLAGVIGFGGGLILIAVLPMFLSPALIIPVHGITQLASNASRMAFSFQHVQWSLFTKFLIGSVAGVLIFGLLLTSIPTEYVPVAIGAYILLNLWSQRFAIVISKYENYYLLGLLQTGLGLIVGSPGPLSLSLLTKNFSSKDEIIATNAMFLTISHLAKIPVFSFIGVALLDELSLIIYMLIGAVLGSYFGTKLRMAVKNDRVITVVKVLLTVMAIKMIVAVLF